jgi:hypothetical protein
VLEEEEDSVLTAALRRLADSLHEPLPALRIRRLERVVVTLDPGPDDEVRPERAREVGGRDRAATGLLPRLLVRRREPAAAEARIEVQASRDAVDVVVAELFAHFVQVFLGELLRIVELVAVDEVAKTGDGPPHALDSRLARPLGLVAARNEAGRHGPERPDSEAGLHR